MDRIIFSVHSKHVRVKHVLIMAICILLLFLLTFCRDTQDSKKKTSNGFGITVSTGGVSIDDDSLQKLSKEIKAKEKASSEKKGSTSSGSNNQNNNNNDDDKKNDDKKDE